jgi:hypothetical protein
MREGKKLACYLRPVRPLLRSAELATLQPEASAMMMGVQEKVLPAPYANWNPTQFVAASQRILQSDTVGVPPLYLSKLEEGIMVQILRCEAAREVSNTGVFCRVSCLVLTRSRLSCRSSGTRLRPARERVE